MAKIKVDLRNGFFLVAETGYEPYNEVYIGIENNEGVWMQDLAVAAREYMTDPVTGEPVHRDSFSVKVWGDCDNEDFTEEVFGISLCRE